MSSNEPVREVSQHTTPVEDLPSHLGDGFEPQPPEPALHRSTRQRFESEYFKRLKAGEGTADRRTTQLIKMAKAAIEELFNGTMRTGECPDDDDVIFAMVAGIAEAEALNPSTVDEARSRPDWEKWEMAIAAKLRSLDDTQMWRVVERPIGMNVVGCKWVFKIKQNAAGEIDKYKARLVMKGYSQVQGVDYDDTYTPIARLSSLRTILAIAARNNWDIEVFDFHLAFLNGKLNQDKDIYMELPPGYKTNHKYKCPVAKLLVALYRSKQGALKWYLELCRMLRTLKLTRAESNWGVFYLHIGHDILILASHVNDCTLTGSSPSCIKAFKEEIKAQYKILDLGPINWLLGMKVMRNRDACTIALSQTTYIDAILTKYNFSDLKLLSIPMDPNIKLSCNQAPSSPTEAAWIKHIPYRAAVGSLMHLAVGTRPDIAFAVSTVAQFSNEPGTVHWEAVKRIYRYLAGTKGLALTFGAGKKGLEGYTDVDSASQEHRHAISGHAYILDGGAVSWMSKKQELVTLSTAEAEYVAATHAVKEGVWLCHFIEEVFQPLVNPTVLYCDNQAAIALTKDGSFHARTKHIDIRYHFIHFIVDSGSFLLVYCPTADMTADTLTKALPSVKVKHFATALGLRTTSGGVLTR